MANVLCNNVIQLLLRYGCLDLNALILELINFDHGDPLEWSSATTIGATHTLVMLEEGGQHSVCHWWRY